MNKIMTLYEMMKLNKSETKLFETLKDCERYIEVLIKEGNPEISLDMVINIFKSMIVFVYQKLGRSHEVSETEESIKNFNFTISNKAISTLAACKSLCWSKYHRHHPYEADKFIRKAIELNPNCTLWHFILALNLRRQRRASSIDIKPSEEEMAKFKLAYEKDSNNAVYTIFYAQMYRELKCSNQAMSLYLELFNRQPTSLLIILRLAIGFIRLKNFEKARECLDKARVINPNNSMYLHYQAAFFMKSKMFHEAIPYLKRAMEYDNFSSEKEYIFCLINIHKNVNVIIKHLEKILQKYRSYPEHELQSIYLDLAFSYCHKNDFKKALNHFFKALKINPEAKCITNYTNYLQYANDTNIYKVLINEFLPLIKRQGYKIRPQQRKKIIELQNYCNQSSTNSFIPIQCNKPGRVSKKRTIRSQAFAAQKNRGGRFKKRGNNKSQRRRTQSQHQHSI